MRAIFMAILLVATPLTTALADNDVGCGVGTQVMEGKTGLEYKLAASFTNGLTFQTISITFGLLNCDGRNTVTVDSQLRHFMDTNIDQLARDMSTGRGEALDALSGLLGVIESDRASFAAFTQREYAALFSSDSIGSTELLENLNRRLALDARLAAYAG